MLHNLPNFYVMSIDPGANLGISISRVDVNNKQMVVVMSTTVYIDKLLRNLPEIEQLVFSRQTLIDKHVGRLLLAYMELFHVDHVIYESAYSSVSITAYTSLLMYGKLIDKVAMQYDPFISVESVAPSAVKRCIGVKGNSGDKTLVRQAVLSHPDIAFDHAVDIDGLSEHAFDSIAMGYYAISTLIDRL